MNENLIRQLKDIQILATSLLTQELTPEKIEYFFKYSEEIQSYIKKNIKDELINELIFDIPNKELEDLVRSSKTVDIFNLDLAGFFKKSNANDAKDLIAITKNKYGSIEILLKE